MNTSIFLWTLVVVSALACIEAIRAGLLLSWNLAHEPAIGDMTPTVRPNTPLHVSATLPAKDEEAWIEASAGALLASDYPSLDLILINDRSADRTGEIMERIRAKDPRVTVLTIRESADGWTGKTNALFQGANAAKGDLLLFTDADSVVSPETLGRCVDFFSSQGLDLMSLLPGFISRGFGENVVLPHLILGLLYLNPLNQVNYGGHAAVLAAGCFLLMNRRTYEALGTWERYRTELTEDIALSRAAKRAGMRIALLPGDTLIRTRPARNVSELAECWTRILYGSCEKRPGKLARLLVVYCGILGMFILNAYALVSAIFTPFRPENGALLVVTGIGIASLSVPVAIFFGKHAGGAWYAATSPLGVLIGAWISIRALLAVLLDRGVKWRDAVYR